jgi:hypothetical protein
VITMVGYAVDNPGFAGSADRLFAPGSDVEPAIVADNLHNRPIWGMVIRRPLLSAITSTGTSAS